MRHLVGHAAQHEPPCSAHSTISDHDEVGADVLGDADEGVGGLAGHDMLLDLDALILRRGRRVIGDLGAFGRYAPVHVFHVDRRDAGAGRDRDAPE